MDVEGGNDEFERGISRTIELLDPGLEREVLIRIILRHEFKLLDDHGIDRILKKASSEIAATASYPSQPKPSANPCSKLSAVNSGISGSSGAPTHRKRKRPIGTHGESGEAVKGTKSLNSRHNPKTTDENSNRLPPSTGKKLNMSKSSEGFMGKGGGKKGKGKKRGGRGQRNFDWSSCRLRNVLLKFAYIGENYHGFVTQEDVPGATVEDELLHALEKTCLVYNRRQCGYSRCGRTDKGVSALGNVVSLHLRSALTEGVGVLPIQGWQLRFQNGIVDDGCAGCEEKGGKALYTEEEKVVKDGEFDDGSGNKVSPWSISEQDLNKELDYPSILNPVLPPDIRIVAWAPAPPQVTARFSCFSRVYKYFLFDDGMDLEAMQKACHLLKGRHDFRNFCKMDHVNVTQFWRAIDNISIKYKGLLPQTLSIGDNPTPSAESIEDASDSIQSGRNIAKNESKSGARNPDGFLEVTIQGNAFLWHQVRMTMAILIMVGKRQEKPTIVQDLLDTKRWPAKPSYLMASDVPLVLYDCLYKHVPFIYSIKEQARALSDFHHLWRQYAIKGVVCSLFKRQLGRNLVRCRPNKLTKAAHEEIDASVVCYSLNHQS
ncbi:hypothetical protein AAMO2058_000312900 [Amorphochlora amoebiformis]